MIHTHKGALEGPDRGQADATSLGFTSMLTVNLYPWSKRLQILHSLQFETSKLLGNPTGVFLHASPVHKKDLVGCSLLPLLFGVSRRSLLCGSLN
jgi:hypothetical protein